MQFRNFAETLLGSKVKVKVLRKLLTEEFLPSERELAGLIGVSHTAVIRALKDLEALNLVSPIRVGRAVTWRLNKLSYAYAFLEKPLENFRTPPLEDLRNTLRKTLSSWKEVKKAVIYGSVAEGREGPSSDIDLFILVGSELERKRLLNLMQLTKSVMTEPRYGNRLSPQIFTAKDASNPKNRKFLESVNRGIVVFER